MAAVPELQAMFAEGDCILLWVKSLGANGRTITERQQKAKREEGFFPLPKAKQEEGKNPPFVLAC